VTRRSRWLLGALPLVLLLVVTEWLFYFPLTPLSLDRMGQTRLPAAPHRVRLLFVGDTLLADRARRTLAHRGFDYPFDGTRGLLASADLTVGNLEGPISYSGRRVAKRWSYRMHAGAALALRRAGFDAVDLANNHIRDCGDVGLRESMVLLEAVGVATFGAGMTEARAHRAVVHDAGGVSVALLGYVAPHIGVGQGSYSMQHVAWGPGQGGAAWGTIDRIRRDLDLARTRARVTVVSIHMGDRYQQRPTPFERELCRQVIEAGADAVIGHGTHVMGSVEIHDGRPIVYGLGNFAFGSMNVFARFSLIAALELDRRRGTVAGLQLLPIFTMNANPWVDFQPKVLVGHQARVVLHRVLSLSGAHVRGLRLASGPDRLVWSVPSAGKNQPSGS